MQYMTVCFFPLLSSSIFLDPLKRKFHFAYLLALDNLAAIFCSCFFFIHLVNLNTFPSSIIEKADCKK